MKALFNRFRGNDVNKEKTLRTRSVGVRLARWEQSRVVGRTGRR